MVNVLLVVVVILLFVTGTLLLRGERRFSPLEYYARGKESDSRWPRPGRS